MNRFVFDTNFWLSIFIARRMEKLASIAFKNNLEIFTSDSLKKEIKSTFYHKHIYKKKLFPPFKEYIDFHNEACEWNDVEPRSGLIHDYKDNFIYDLCIQSRAQYLVTNDSDFDILKTFRRPAIVVLTVAEFWKAFR